MNRAFLELFPAEFHRKRHGFPRISLTGIQDIIIRCGFETFLKTATEY
jgi:chorismate mutase